MALALVEQAATANLPVTCTLLDAAPVWGGKIVTHRVAQLVMEAGPDSFLSQKPWAMDLCRRLGLADQLINTNPVSKKASVLWGGQLHELPEGLVTFTPSQLGPFFRSGLLSWLDLARMGCDILIPPRRAVEDESLAAFFRRRFGRHACERVMEPLMAGIYAGDAEQMSLRATFPRFYELEQAYGSVIRGMMAARRARGQQASGEGPQHTMFVTLKNGLADLVEALAARIGQVGGVLKAGVQAEALRVRSTHAGRWKYDVICGDGTALAADALVLATPAYISAELIRPLTPLAAGLMDMIPYASTATISLVYDGKAVGDRLEGFGFVVPRIEGRDLIAATWTSLKWPHRAPLSEVSVRCYLGGVGREAILQRDDEALIRCVRDDLASIVGLQASPHYVEVNRWHRAMPQYTIGHLDRLTQLETALSRFGGLAVTGAAYRGVGIPDCIRDGTETATRMLRYLETLY
ncbi:MAG: Protoporphyrinogen oxidase [Nitrospirae bacterium]|nr:MAG: protoporphyrinogen oxidase [Nitrospira sp. OLB3]MBV6468645.1 Protoporphyrinogen oxidase [Nitrospirota bacterium]MCE7963982.1 protoporphyrinogen oxidase [Nitrospira sp. NTP2]MCK6492828.1 protoporphyrinogen oxidase [Nitrospira sp.]MCK6498551.1 protoporphyrinogen oxidase [Nitrospira sp.]